MAIVRYRYWRTRGVYLAYPAFRRTIAEEYRRRLFPLVTAEARHYTSGWQVSVEWDQDTDIGDRGIAHYMYPVGPGAQAWEWVSRGVEGRYISVRKQSTFRGIGSYKPHLSLQRYKPYTAPGGFYGGPGIRYGPVGYRRVVWWPGIRPRNFEEHMADSIRQQHISISESAVRKGIRAAQREGR